MEFTVHLIVCALKCLGEVEECERQAAGRRAANTHRNYSNRRHFELPTAALFDSERSFTSRRIPVCGLREPRLFCGPADERRGPAAQRRRRRRPGAPEPESGGAARVVRRELLPGAAAAALHSVAADECECGGGRRSVALDQRVGCRRAAGNDALAARERAFVAAQPAAPAARSARPHAPLTRRRRDRYQHQQQHERQGQHAGNECVRVRAAAAAATSPAVPAAASARDASGARAEAALRAAAAAAAAAQPRSSRYSSISSRAVGLIDIHCDWDYVSGRSGKRDAEELDSRTNPFASESHLTCSRHAAGKRIRVFANGCDTEAVSDAL